MLANKDSINWIQKNIIGKDIKEWKGSGFTPGPSSISVQPGGYIEHTLIKENGEPVLSSNYTKIGLDILGDVSDIDEYNNDIDVIVTEKYSTEDTDFNRARTRTLAVTKANMTDREGASHSVFLMEMIHKPLLSFTFKIVNRTSRVREFKWFGLYASQDVGTYQYGEIQKDYMSKYGTYIEPRTTDPENPAIGRIWLRVDIAPTP